MVLLDLGRDLAPSWAPLGLAVFLLVVLALLWFSMRRHLKRADYPDVPAAAADEGDPPVGPGHG